MAGPPHRPDRRRRRTALRPLTFPCWQWPEEIPLKRGSTDNRAQALAAPSGSRVIGATPTAVRFGWQGNASGETGCRVVLRRAGGTWKAYWLEGVRSALTLRDLRPGVIYEVAVAACNNSECSDCSPVLVFTTPMS